MAVELAKEPGSWGHSLAFRPFKGVGKRLSKASLGALSEDQIETIRLVHDEQIETYCQDILSKILLAAHADGKLPVPNEVRFHLIDAENLAFHFEEKNVSHLCIDRALFDLIETEDELAFVMGHELGHPAYKREHGVEKPIGTSVLEEVYCDKAGMNLAELAGYNRNGGARFFEQLLEVHKTAKKGAPYQQWVGKVASLTDCHLEMTNRYALLRDDFTGAERLQTGDQEIGRSSAIASLAPGIKERAATLHHTGYLRKLAAKRGWDSMDLIGRLSFLDEQCNAVTNPARDKEFSALLEEASANVSNLPAKSVIRAQGLLEHIFDFCISKGLEGSIPHIRVLRRCGGRASRKFYEIEGKGSSSSASDTVQPFGRLLKLERSVSDFVAARSLEEAVRAAQGYMEEVKVLDLFENSVEDKTFGAPVRITLPRLPEDAASTERALSWAASDATGAVVLLLYRERYRDHLGSELVPLQRASLSAIKKVEPLLERHEFSLRFSYRDDWLAKYVKQRERNEAADVDVRQLAANPAAFYERYRDLLHYPTAEDVSPASPYFGLTTDERVSLHNSVAQKLCDEFRRLASHRRSRKTARKIIFSFLLDGHDNSPVKQFLGDRNSLPIPPDHPVVRFIAKTDLLNTGEKLFALRSIRLAPQPVEWWSAAAGFEIPPTIHDFEAFLKKHSVLSIPVSPYTSYTKYVFHDSSSARDMASGLLYSLLCTAPDNGECAIVALRIAGAYLKVGPYSQEQKELRALIRERVWPEGLEAARLPESLSAEDLAACYGVMSELNLFPDAAARHSIGIRALEAISALPKAGDRRALTETLLFDHGGVRDVEMRDSCVRLWADAMAGVLGRDNGSSLFLEKTMGALKSTGTNHPALRHQMFAELADSLVAQRRLAFALEKATKIAVEDLAKLNVPVKGVEELFLEAGKDPRRAREILDFITAPLTQDSIDIFRVQVGAWCRDYSAFHHLRRLLMEAERNHLTREESLLIQRLLFHDVHTYFWGQTAPVRVLLTKQILLNAERLYDDRQNVLDFAIELVLDKLFPLKDPGDDSSESLQANWGRKCVRAFLIASDQSEWGFILSAMLAAGEQSQSDPLGMSTGKKLRCLLESLGPAYIKLGQAIHSYPNTPEDIRRELLDLKGMAAKPLRWDFLRLLDETLPKEVAKRFYYIGPILGAASFNIVAGAKERWKGKRVLAVLRPYARPLAEKGFDNLAAMLEALEKDNPEISKFKDDALSIIGHARGMTATETDMMVGARQYRVARGHYDGVVVRANSRRVSFRVASWTDYGETWRCMKEGGGLTFDKLPEATAEERSFKQAAAKAIVTIELQNILRGDVFDCDRHERQYLVDRQGRITAIDHGGMSIEPPNEDEKKEFVSLILKTASAAKSGSLAGFSLEQLSKGMGAGSDYIKRVHKGLLALSFAITRMTPDDLKEIVAAVAANGEIDSLVLSGLSDLIPEEYRSMARRHQSPAVRFMIRLFAWRKWSGCAIRPGYRGLFKSTN